MLAVVRDAALTFPPKRLRVLNWYDAIWQSLVYHQRTWGWQHDKMVATMVDHAHVFARQSLLFRAVAAHTISRRVLLRDCEALGVKPLEWRILITYRDDELATYLAERVPAELRPEQVAYEIQKPE